MKRIRTIFDCTHETEVEVSIDDEVEIPERVRGVGQCPGCMGEERVIAISGVAPQSGGRRLVLDSILMIPMEG